MEQIGAKEEKKRRVEQIGAKEEKKRSVEQIGVMKAEKRRVEQIGAKEAKRSMEQIGAKEANLGDSATPGLVEEANANFAADVRSAWQKEEQVYWRGIGQRGFLTAIVSRYLYIVNNNNKSKLTIVFTLKCSA